MQVEETRPKLALSVEAAAFSVGVSGPTLRRLIQKGALPAVQISQRRWVVPIKSLEEWLARRAAENLEREHHA